MGLASIVPSGQVTAQLQRRRKRSSLFHRFILGQPMKLFKSTYKVFFAAMVAVAFFGSPLFALEVPALKGRVNDYAGIISDAAERQLETVLADLERTDSTQIVVLTISSLKGDSLEDFSIRVAEQWKIGQKNNDNGAILLVSKQDRKIRIEVGYGLEGKLTDLMSGRIIRNVITPNFKSGDFDAGIVQGVSAMIGTVKGLYTAESKPAGTRRRSSSPGLFGLFCPAFCHQYAWKGKPSPWRGIGGGDRADSRGGTVWPWSCRHSGFNSRRAIIGIASGFIWRSVE